MTPFFALFIFASVAKNPSLVNAEPNNGLVTQTVYGFLDFTTTIGNTVMVFSPNTAPPLVIPNEKKIDLNPIETRPPSNDKTTNIIKPTKSFNESKKDSKSKVTNVKRSKIEILSSKVDIITDVESVTKSPLNDKRKVISKVEIKEADMETIESSFIAPSKSKVVNNQIEIRQSEVPQRIYNDLNEPEYDFLSRQPSEYVEESYRVINLKPSANGNHKNRGHNTKHNSQKDAHPTGLVTKLSGTIIKEGLTTIHETSVIGTFISDKYAQVLQSSSHIYKNNNKPKIAPSSTVRILKTAAPSSSRITYNANTNTPPTSAVTPSNRNRRLEGQSGKFHNRFRNKNRNEEQPTTEKVISTTSQSYTKSNRNENKNRRSNKNVNSAHRTTTTQPPSNTNEPLPRRGFKKQKVSSSSGQSEPSTTLYKFKLNRAPGRWQYKTSPKPRVTIRKSAGSEPEDDVSTIVSKASQISEDLVSNDILSSQNGEQINLESSVPISDTAYNELESEATATAQSFPAETLNVEISTPSDFKETYYEIATIKTPYTFQVGTVKNTRFITVTSTFEKSLEPETKQTVSPMEPLTENIYTAPQTRDVNFLDTSIATLSPLYLSSDEETVPLETMTETYSMVQKILKTQILPVIKEGQNASSLTLVHTYRVTRFVTATKTLPPSDAYQFVASKRLKEFNTKLDEAGSEHHLELEFGDLNEDDDDVDQDDVVSEDDDSIFDFLNNDGSRIDQHDANRPKTDEIKNSKKKSNKNNENPSRNSQISPEQLQQLALLGLLNPAAAAQLPQIITTSKPRITLETLYESHLIPFFNGHSTSYSTITKSIGTRSKTDYELVTTTLALPLPPVPVNPLFPQQQQPQHQFQITTAPIVTQTVATEINSKVLKLTFGAKTAYTTLFSTRVVPTILTTFITTSLPVQQPAAFPGYYPSPFAPFHPFVG